MNAFKTKQIFNKNTGLLGLILTITLSSFLIILIVSIAASVKASLKTTKIEIPTFHQYVINLGDTYEGKIAEIDLNSHPKAKMFKTVLQEGIKNGPNFAFYYTIIEWGCGTECQSFAVVDVRDGKVYFPGFGARWGFNFKEDSNLLVVNPVEMIYEVGGQNLNEGTEYYIWDNNQFKLIKKAKIRYIVD